MQKLSDLWEIVEKLRNPESGCPWDLKQTPKSLIPNFIEELYETIEAIENDDPEHLKEELGDLLLHILMQVRIAKEEGKFTLGDVLDNITHKLVSRHPHVFGEDKEQASGSKSSAEEIKTNWERIKHKEKRATRKSILDGIPKSMPALIYAQRMQEKAASVGFDWQKAEDVLVKVEEELTELQQAEEQDNEEMIIGEIGDLLFTVVNYARKRGIDAEAALMKTAGKFFKRFRAIEKHHLDHNENIYDSSMEKLDDLWETTKKDN